MVWALAKMEQHVESETLQQLLATAVRLAHKCTAQGLNLYCGEVRGRHFGWASA